jgi:uncharacterized membrane protein
MIPFVAGVISAGIAYVAGRWSGFGRGPAFVAGILLALSPVAIVYSSRVKHYTVEMVLAVVLIALALRLMGRIDDRRAWIVFAVAVLGATFVSTSLVLYGAAPFLVGVVTAWRRGDRANARWITLVASATGTTLIFWYVGYVRGLTQAGLTQYWRRYYISIDSGLSQATGQMLAASRRLMGGLTGLGDLGNVALDVAAAAMLVAFLLVARRYPHRAVVLIAPFVLAAALAMLKLAPLGGGRTDLYLYPSLVFLLIAGIDAVSRPRQAQQRWPWVRRHGVWALIAVAVLVLEGSRVEPPTYPRQDVRSLVTVLESRMDADDIVLVYPHTAFAFGLYSPFEVDIETSKEWQGLPFTVTFPSPEVTVLPYSRDDPDNYRPTIEAATQGHDRVWLISSHRSKDYGALLEIIGRLGLSLQDRVKSPGAELLLFGRVDVPSSP